MKVIRGLKNTLRYVFDNRLKTFGANNPTALVTVWREVIAYYKHLEGITVPPNLNRVFVEKAREKLYNKLMKIMPKGALRSRKEYPQYYGYLNYRTFNDFLRNNVDSNLHTNREALNENVYIHYFAKDTIALNRAIMKVRGHNSNSFVIGYKFSNAYNKLVPIKATLREMLSVFKTSINYGKNRRRRRLLDSEEADKVVSTFLRVLGAPKDLRICAGTNNFIMLAEGEMYRRHRSMTTRFYQTAWLNSNYPIARDTGERHSRNTLWKDENSVYYTVAYRDANYWACTSDGVYTKIGIKNCRHCGLRRGADRKFTEMQDYNSNPITVCSNLAFAEFVGGSKLKGSDVVKLKKASDRAIQKTMYMGVEIETQGMHSSGTTISRMPTQTLQGQNWIVPKSDGSIGNGEESYFTDDRGNQVRGSQVFRSNIEWCSIPMTYEAHMKSGVWEQFCKDAVSVGMYGYNARNCGIHIHVSNIFTKREIANIIQFMHSSANLSFIEAVGQRRLNQYCPQHPHYLDYVRRNLGRRHTKQHYGQQFRDHYAAVGVTNKGTLEFRIFRSNLNLASFYKNLQFVDAVVAYCRKAKFLKTNLADFKQYIRENKAYYPYLYKFLMARGALTSSFVESKKEFLEMQPKLIKRLDRIADAADR